MAKIIINESEFVVGGGYELLRVWRKLCHTCWTRYSNQPTICRGKIYALRVIPVGEGQSQDWPEVEWFTASQLIAMLADM